HGETFDLPPGAELLASSEACRNQAFRASSHVYGIQFHLEVTPLMIAEWCAEEANAADMREFAAPIEPAAHEARLAALANHVFGRWCQLLK
ncbi:MAG: type 1 glutamine amidotransferase, partial [Acidobacteria bacterium]|nr:type 1 glutamine amidotransferase [Acidobacteriota bacterium]